MPMDQLGVTSLALLETIMSIEEKTGAMFPDIDVDTLTCLRDLRGHFPRLRA